MATNCKICTEGLSKQAQFKLRDEMIKSIRAQVEGFDPRKTDVMREVLSLAQQWDDLSSTPLHNVSAAPVAAALLEGVRTVTGRDRPTRGNSKAQKRRLGK